jgi:hypothetical protein
MNSLKRYLASVPKEIDLNSFALLQTISALMMCLFSVIMNDRAARELTASQANATYGLFIISVLTWRYSYTLLGIYNKDLWINNPLLYRQVRVLMTISFWLYLVIFVSSFEKGEKGLIRMNEVRTMYSIWIVMMGGLGWLSGFQIPTNHSESTGETKT